MDQLKNLTLPAWGRLVIYLALTAAGLALAALAGMGFGVYAELPDGTWTYTFTVTSAQLSTLITLMIGGGFTAVFSLLKGVKTRVGDVPVAERLGEKPLSSPTTGARV